jgi:hypothetical protein
VGFERTIPASEQAKTVHALDRSATVTGKANLKKKSAYQMKTNHFRPKQRQHSIRRVY